MLEKRYIWHVVVGCCFYDYGLLGTRVLMRLKGSQNTGERESRMPICFPDRAMITKGKRQALTLSELERREHYMWMPKTPRGFLAHVSMYMCIL